MFRSLTIFVCLMAASAFGQKQAIIWTPQEKVIAARVQALRQVPDEKRGSVTKELAGLIAKLPPAANKLTLASSLANLATEGDFGQEALQAVAGTLAGTLREQAAVSKEGMPEEPWLALAQLIRYEHVQLPPDAVTASLLNTAMARLQSEDQRRQTADFTLTDLQGRSWTLRQLRGKVVLVNFWDTQCPPCARQMPDLESLYQQFNAQGLVILAISDEDAAKVKPFMAQTKVSYPVLLDPGGKANRAFAVEGFPKSFVYDREGKLVAQAMDRRTRGQFLEMLDKAGLR